MIPRNGNVSYNGNNYLTPDDSIRNGSFNVQTIDDWVSVIEQETGIGNAFFLKLNFWFFHCFNRQSSNLLRIFVTFPFDTVLQV